MWMSAWAAAGLELPVRVGAIGRSLLAAIELNRLRGRSCGSEIRCSNGTESLAAFATPFDRESGVLREVRSWQ